MSAQKPDYINVSVVKMDGTAYVGDAKASPRRRSGYGGGKGGGGVDSMIPIKEYVDARDDAVESRLSAKLDVVLSELSKLPKTTELEASRQSTVRNIWGGVLTLAGVSLAVLAFGGDRFEGGMAVSPIIAQVTKDQQKIDQTQDAKLGLIDSKLDVLIKQTASK